MARSPTALALLALALPAAALALPRPPPRLQRGAVVRRTPACSLLAGSAAEEGRALPSDGEPLPPSSLRTPEFRWKAVAIFALNPAALMPVAALLAFAFRIPWLGPRWAVSRAAVAHGTLLALPRTHARHAPHPPSAAPAAPAAPRPPRPSAPQMSAAPPPPRGVGAGGFEWAPHKRTSSLIHRSAARCPRGLSTAHCVAVAVRFP